MFYTSDVAVRLALAKERGAGATACHRPADALIARANADSCLPQPQLPRMFGLSSMRYPGSQGEGRDENEQTPRPAWTCRGHRQEIRRSFRKGVVVLNLSRQHNLYSE